MARPTLGEILTQAKKERDKIQKKAIKTVEDLIPPVISGVLPLGPEIVRKVVEVENALMDYAIDQLVSEAGHLPIGPPEQPPRRFLQDLEFPARTGGRPIKPRGLTEEQVYGRKPRVRSDKQLVNDQIQREALTSINIRARKKDGSFKKGWNQRRIMLLAQKECTRERERLGLCKRKRKRGSRSR